MSPVHFSLTAKQYLTSSLHFWFLLNTSPRNSLMNVVDSSGFGFDFVQSAGTCSKEALSAIEGKAERMGVRRTFQRQLVLGKMRKSA